MGASFEAFVCPNQTTESLPVLVRIIPTDEAPVQNEHTDKAASAQDLTS